MNRSGVTGAIIVCSLAATLGAHPAGAALDPSSKARTGLSLMHQGRFEEASSVFREISEVQQADPEGPLGEALTTWWKLLDRPKDPRLLKILDSRLEECIRRGEALTKGSDPLRGRVLAGTALLLMAQSRAAARSYFAAGSAARQGHKHLVAALEADPQADDAWFALGAYKYFAARLPWLVRALRFFVFIPGGDAEEGIRGLGKAAEKGRFFPVESSLMLAYIHSTDEDNDLRLSLKHLASARAVDSDSPLFAAVQARFLFMLGRLGAAEASAREAIELSARLPGVAAEIPALARLRLALSLYYQYRPREALAALEPLAVPAPPLPGDSIETYHALLGRLQTDPAVSQVSPPAATEGAPGPGGVSIIPPRLVAAAPLPADPLAAAAIAHQRGGCTAGAIDALSTLVAGDPDDAVARYHLARAYQQAGRDTDAARELQRCLAPGVRLPRTLQGWALIRLGFLHQREGRRGEAEKYYRKGADLGGFVFRRAADDLLRNPADPVPPEG